MDNNNQKSPADYTDLAKQYQDILEKYSQELAKNEPQTPPVASTPQTNPIPLSTETQSNVSPLPESSLPSPAPENLAEVPSENTVIEPPESSLADTQLQPAPAPEIEKPEISDGNNESLADLAMAAADQAHTEINSAPTVSSPELSLPSPPPEPELPASTSPENPDITPSATPPEIPVNPFPEVGPAPADANPKASSLPKVFFVVTLLIFLGVATAVGFKFFNSRNPSASSSNSSNNNSSVVSPTATSVPSDKICEVNDQKYTVGQTFAATDGCNTCTCTSDLVITCTQKACTASPSSSPANSTATLPKNWLAYANAKFNYSLKYPNTLTLNQTDIKKDPQNALNRIVLTFNSSSNITVSIWAKAVAPTLSPDNAKNYTATTVSGLPAKQGREFGSVYMMNTYVYGDQYVYQIQYSGEEIQKQLDVYQQILTNFSVNTKAVTPAAVASPSVTLKK